MMLLWTAPFSFTRNLLAYRNSPNSPTSCSDSHGSLTPSTCIYPVTKMSINALFPLLHIIFPSAPLPLQYSLHIFCKQNFFKNVVTILTPAHLPWIHLPHCTHKTELAFTLKLETPHWSTLLSSWRPHIGQLYSQAGDPTWVNFTLKLETPLWSTLLSSWRPHIGQLYSQAGDPTWVNFTLKLETPHWSTLLSSWRPHMGQLYSQAGDPTLVNFTLKLQTPHGSTLLSSWRPHMGQLYS